METTIPFPTAASSAADTEAASALPAASPDVGAEAGESRLACMCFQVGPIGLLFPADEGREVIAPPPVSRVPNTASWVRGVANVRGELVPVVDTAAALGVTRDTRLRPYLLILGQGETAVGLLIDGLPRLLNLGESQRLAQVPPAPPLLADSVAGAYEHGGREWLNLDLHRLFDALAQQMACA